MDGLIRTQVAVVPNPLAELQIFPAHRTEIGVVWAASCQTDESQHEISHLPIVRLSQSRLKEGTVFTRHFACLLVVAVCCAGIQYKGCLLQALKYELTTFRFGSWFFPSFEL